MAEPIKLFNATDGVSLPHICSSGTTRSGSLRFVPRSWLYHIMNAENPFRIQSKDVQYHPRSVSHHKNSRHRKVADCRMRSKLTRSVTYLSAPAQSRLARSRIPMPFLPNWSATDNLDHSCHPTSVQVRIVLTSKGQGWLHRYWHMGAPSLP